MKVLLVLNRQPYDGTDVTWNALRLAGKLLEKGAEVRIFLMNDAVDLAREETVKPESYDHDLVKMLKDLIEKGVTVKACGSCMARCGIHKNKPYFEGVEKSNMNQLVEWIFESDRVLTF
ncbi:MAG: sulfur reduction protein DsrE [Desulfurobacterium sp.]|nr:MAG: sulfur reduction protein DsrE [Desulfurobacterium sp.]